MKPVDHPQFFRMPAPAGRSRESTIVLDGSGRFVHDGERFRHRGLERGFTDWIRRHPEDGRFILCNGYDWCYFTVEQTPFFVSNVFIEKRPLEIELFDGTREPLSVDTLTLDDEGVLRVSVKDGAYQARFMRLAQIAMMPLLDESEGEIAVVVDAERYPIRVAS